MDTSRPNCAPGLIRRGKTKIAKVARARFGNLGTLVVFPGILRCFLLFVVAVSLSGPARGGDRPVADLFPAETLAYAEATDFPKLAPTLAAWVKDTALADGVAAQHDRRDAIKEFKFLPTQADLARLGLLASPEFLADLAKVRGAAVAFTGFNEKHQPRLVLAVRLGDSTALSLYARMLVTADPDTRRVESVEGVPICQYRPTGGPSYGPDGQIVPMNASKAAVGSFEPTYAFTPGLLVIGSDPPAVADVIRRHLGKEPKPSLATASAFRSTDHPPGDVFLFAKPADLVARLDSANKAAGNPNDPDWLAAVKLALNPKAVPIVTGTLRLDPDGWSMTLTAASAPNEKSPLLALLGGEASTSPVPLPGGLGASGSVALPAAKDRAGAVFDVADAVAKAVGCLGPLPGERYVGSPDVGPLLGSVRNVGIEFPVKDSRPIVVLTCDSADAAAAWVAAVPALVQKTLRSSAATLPVVETVAGVTVSAVTTGESGAGHFYYAAKGPRVAAGFDRPALLAALAREAKPAADRVHAAVAVSPLTLFERFGPAAPAAFPALGVAAVVGPAPQALPAAPTVTLKDVLAPVPPVSATLLRENGKLVLRFEQTRWNDVRVRVLDTAVSWWNHYLTGVRQPATPFFPHGLGFDR